MEKIPDRAKKLLLDVGFSAEWFENENVKLSFSKQLRVAIANQFLNGVTSPTLKSALSSELNGELDEIFPGRSYKNERYQMRALNSIGTNKIRLAWEKKLSESQRKLTPTIMGLFSAVWPEKNVGGNGKSQEMDLIRAELDKIQESIDNLRSKLDL